MNIHRNRKRGLWLGALLVCIVFIIAGAFNYGFSRFYPALPFVVGAAFFAHRWRGKPAMSIVLLFSVVAIVSNMYLERNPLVFPILNEGVIELNRDGFLKLYQDGSSHFVRQRDSGECIGCGPIKYIPVRRGEQYRVIGVVIRHPDFSTKVHLKTKIGSFSQSNYESGSITLNKPVKSTFIEYLSYPLYFPVLLF